MRLWEDTETLLAKGVANRWWRVLRSGRAFWLKREKVKSSPEQVLEAELIRFRSELDRVVSFLTNDASCRRIRLVQYLNSGEEPLAAIPCCDFCQVELGLGHPWLGDRLLSRPRYDLQPLEAMVFSELEGNLKQEEAFARKMLHAIKGSHLAHRNRLMAYLEQLRRLGLATCASGVWGLSKSGQQGLETRSFPTWQEVHGGKL